MVARLPLQLFRKKLGTVFISVITIAFCTIILVNYTPKSESRVDVMERKLLEMQHKVHYVEKLYFHHQVDLLVLENRLDNSSSHDAENCRDSANCAESKFPIIINTDKNVTGTHALVHTYQGFKMRNIQKLAMPPMSYHFLPHLANDSNSIRPLFNVRGRRNFVDIVIGVPSVKRDKESYLIITLTQLIEKLSAEEEPNVLIVVYLGETDPNFILDTSLQIENTFPGQIKSGLIEILAPSSSFYPDISAMRPTLGDPMNRFKWRTKQNLDSIYLMTYCHGRGTFYLMLEDDIVVKNKYIEEMKSFIAEVTVSKPNWIVIEFCRIGGIGKMFRSSQLIYFIAYVQMFYTNMPIDWLIESYLFDRVCTIEQNRNSCQSSKLQVRPRYQTSLFQHIGFYSSLSGKIQRIKDTHFGNIPLFIPHDNPPLDSLRTTIKQNKDYSLMKAYNGLTFFWGLTPVKGDFVEFNFTRPVKISRFKFQSGNLEHVSDIFYDTVAQVLPASVNASAGGYVTVCEFSRRGLCEGTVGNDLGSVRSLRLLVNSNSDFWVILSEIFIEETR